jgi:hypothetical protein
MVLESYPPPAMAAAPIDPFAELASSVSDLEELAACLKIQLQALSMQVLQRPQPLAPLVPATSAKMPKHVITDVIVTQLPLFLASRSQYHIYQFRKHCEPFLPIGTADIELDCDGIPKWYGRFNYSHNQVARLRGFIANNRGKWKVPAGYK